MKVLITGISGQLGQAMSELLENRKIEYSGFSSEELDICDSVALKSWLLSYRPDAVIHCAGYTDVDSAEDDAEICWRINVSGTENVATACNMIGAKLMYISSDYVFSGEDEAPHEINEQPCPLNVYGKSKYAGELAVVANTDRYFIVRTSWLVGRHGRNFVKTMLDIAKDRDTVSVVDDQTGSPTFASDLAELLLEMLNTEKYGIYHASNEGFCSWAEFAEAIFEGAGINVAVNRISSAEYNAKADRPKNSRLSKESLTQNGFSPLPDWRQSLSDYLKDQANE